MSQHAGPLPIAVARELLREFVAQHERQAWGIRDPKRQYCKCDLCKRALALLEKL